MGKWDWRAPARTMVFRARGRRHDAPRTEEMRVATGGRFKPCSSFEVTSKLRKSSLIVLAAIMISAHAAHAKSPA